MSHKAKVFSVRFWQMILLFFNIHSQYSFLSIASPLLFKHLTPYMPPEESTYVTHSEYAIASS
ncbi:hypothetical protein CFP56_009651 [Quercus suber]|uniref:Secreted protein n=1 Tax=Quercus suber TaxID=58331 RepID=A0AAW0M6R3_QUESU